MNAVMPNHSPQYAPYGGGLGEGVDPHAENANYANNNEGNAAINATANSTNANPDPDSPGGPQRSIGSNSEIPTTSPGHQKQQPVPSPTLQQRSVPFGLGNPSLSGESLFHNPVAESFPWSIGSTDGSFALVHLQQQQQQLQMQQQQEELQRRQALAAANNNKSSNSNISLNGDAMSDGTNTASSGDSAEDAGIKPSPSMVAAQASIGQAAQVIRSGRSLYHDRLFHQSSSSVEGVLAASCDAMGFDIAEMWLRTGQKTHQLTNSHLRPTALQDSVRQDLVDVYYGERSNERTHRLSPALCKRAKDANDVVWVTAHTQNGAEALRMSISNVRTAVAVPVCHEASNTNVTIIYFSIRRIVLKPAAVEFLIHMSLSAVVTSVNALSTDGIIDRAGAALGSSDQRSNRNVRSLSTSDTPFSNEISKSNSAAIPRVPSATIIYRRPEKTSVTGARLDLQWRQLMNVEYLTDGGNSWIHTAVFDGKPVVVKTLRPECQDMAMALNEIESEVGEYNTLQ